MDIPTKLYLYTSKDIQKLTNDTNEKQKQYWEVLPYHEENRKKESCSDVVVETIKVNEQQFSSNTSPNILEGKLEGLLGDQILNTKMEVKLGQLIKICPQLPLLEKMVFLLASIVKNYPIWTQVKKTT